MAAEFEEINRQLDEIDGLSETSYCIPDRKKIAEFIERAQAVMFPQIFKRQESRRENFQAMNALLADQIGLARGCQCQDSQKLADRFMEKLPELKKILLTDVEAIYNGDPAAKSTAEVILCYPGFLAIFIYRLAHQLRMMDVPYLPRMMTEYAHEKTGIDINPGAVIGPSFCIDHGTGIVIGETSVIGHHVKLYQGVTIGAKSFEADENGFPVKGGKRHPDLGNHVIVYANATILGGNTRIGDHCVIGGNVWLTSSVEEGTTVIFQSHQ